MATWRDHPQWHVGHLFLLNPATVFAARQNTGHSGAYLSGTGILRHIFVKNITVGDASLDSVKRGMTLLMGTTPGADDLGRACVLGVTTVEVDKAIYVWVSANGKSDGELAAGEMTDPYITVLDDYRVWMKPPYYDNATGIGYFEGQASALGTNYNCRPTANAGMGWAGEADPDTGRALVTFDSRRSYAANPRAVLGAYAEPAVTVVSVTSENGGNVAANMFDGNPATYWESTGAGQQILEIDLALHGLHGRIKKYSITAQSATTAPRYFSLSDDYAAVANTMIDSVADQTGWSAGETRTFYPDHFQLDAATGRACFVFSLNNGAGTFRISELKVYVEDRYEATPGALSETAVAASGEYPGNPATGVQSPGDPTWLTSISGDGAWIAFTFAAAQVVTQVELTNKTLSHGYSPTAFQLQALFGTTWKTVDSFTASWSSDEQTQSFTTSRRYAIPATQWRVLFTASDGGGLLEIQELNMHGYADNNSYATWDVKDGTIVGGTANSACIAVEFPLGFRWVDLTVVDTHTATHTAHVPVFVYGEHYDTPDRPAGILSSTQAFRVQYPLTNVFDKNDSTRGVTVNSPGVPALIGITFASPITISGYVVKGNYAPPTAWTFAVRDGAGTWHNVDTQSGQSTASKKTYLLPQPVEVTGARWFITATSDHTSFLGIDTLDLVMTRQLVGSESPLSDFEVMQRTISAEGQDMAFRLHEEVPLSEYPDGTLVMYWEDEWIDGERVYLEGAGPPDRAHMRFIGWIDTESSRIEAGQTDASGEVELRCVDVGGRLRRLAGFNAVFQRQQNAPASIDEMSYPCLDRLVHVVACHMSTAPDVADLILTETWSYWHLDSYLAQGQTLWEMLANICGAAELRFTCDRSGALRMVYDPMLLPVAKRTSVVQADIDEPDWTLVERARTRPPRHHWLWASAVQQGGYSSSPSSIEITISPPFAVAPGFAPGQGPGSVERGEQLARDYESFLEREGHRYAARMNQPEGLYRVTLAHGAENAIEPARMEWVTLTITGDTVDERGVTLAAARLLPYRVEVDYDHAAGAKTITVELEREVIGVPARLYTPPE